MEMVVHQAVTEDFHSAELFESTKDLVKKTLLILTKDELTSYNPAGHMKMLGPATQQQGSPLRSHTLQSRIRYHHKSKA
jgi:hypothetical protein